MTHRIFHEPPNLNILTTEEGEVTEPWLEWFQDLALAHKTIDILVSPINPASVNANTSAEEAFTITQVVDSRGNTHTLDSSAIVVSSGDYILKVIKPTLSAGLIINQARVTATNEITIEFANLTGSGIDPGSEEYTFIILKG